jgi:hypothetical protein
MARKRLGELLIERQAITASQLESVLEFQRQAGGRLGQVLVAKGYLSEEELCATLGEALGIPVLDVVGGKDWSAIHLLRATFCERHELFPVALEDGHPGRRQLVVAMSDPLNLPAIEEIEFTTGCKVKPMLAPRTKIREAILRFYHNHVGGEIEEDRDESGSMTLVRQDGEEEEILSTRTRPQTAGRARVPKKRPLRDETDVGSTLVIEDPTKSRRELSDMIRAREQGGKPARPGSRSRNAGKMAEDLEFLLGTESPQAAQIEDLERRFWALMRLMARKGLITKEEFQEEFED